MTTLLATTDGGRDGLLVATGGTSPGRGGATSGSTGASSAMSAGDRAAQRAVMDALRED